MVVAVNLVVAEVFFGVRAMIDVIGIGTVDGDEVGLSVVIEAV